MSKFLTRLFTIFVKRIFSDHFFVLKNGALELDAHYVYPNISYFPFHMWKKLPVLVNMSRLTR